jgi:hypothetical protein
MLAHLYTSKHAQNQHLQAFFSLTSFNMRTKKMQNPIIYQNLASLAVGGLLFYALSQHYVAHTTSLVCSAVNHPNLLIEITILLVTMLALFALYTLWLFFKPLFIVGLITMAAVVWYVNNDDLAPVGFTEPKKEASHHRYQEGG